MSVNHLSKQIKKSHIYIKGNYTGEKFRKIKANHLVLDSTPELVLDKVKLIERNQ